MQWILANWHWGSKHQPLCWCGAEHLMELLCSISSKSSQLPHYQCLGWTIRCYFLSKGWMPQSHGNGGIMRHQRQQSVFSFHVGPVTEREGGMGELQAKESICELEHWMDASSIEELWWLQGSLLCSNAIGKAITACTVIWPNDLDPASLIAAIHSGQMAVDLSNVALRRMNKQEDAHVHTSVGKIHMTGGAVLFSWTSTASSPASGNIWGWGQR